MSRRQSVSSPRLPLFSPYLDSDFRPIAADPSLAGYVHWQRRFAAKSAALSRYGLCPPPQPVPRADDRDCARLLAPTPPRPDQQRAKSQRLICILHQEFGLWQNGDGFPGGLAATRARVPGLASRWRVRRVERVAERTSLNSNRDAMRLGGSLADGVTAEREVQAAWRPVNGAGTVEGRRRFAEAQRRRAQRNVTSNSRERSAPWPRSAPSGPASYFGWLKHAMFEEIDSDEPFAVLHKLNHAWSERRRPKGSTTGITSTCAIFDKAVVRHIPCNRPVRATATGQSGVSEIGRGSLRPSH